MGGKDSKPAFITYEDASKRVTDGELKRLKDAFKRSSTLSGYMTKQVFVREVLGDGVPTRLTDQIYVAFGGTSKGLCFKDLVCGLVLLTRGREEEKTKFLFGVYANEALSHVQKEEMDSLVLASEGQAPQELSDLFRESDRVSYDQFKRWCLSHAQATSIMKWLLKEPCTVTLSNDHETPTFYQTLAGVTHLEESDIIELEKRYWMLKGQSKTGRFDLETFKPIVSPPMPESLCEALFMAFDENRDNHIDFKEMACGVSACCRGPQTERQKFCFKIFDQDYDGLLSREELEAMVEVMLLVRKQNKSTDDLEIDGMKDVTPSKLASEILEKHDSDKDGHITQEEYLVWTVTHPLPEEFLNLLFEVCHVVLGLKPLTKEEEGQVIIAWLEREEREGLKMGQTWYLVSMHWWRQWLDYVQYKPVQGFPESNMVNNNNHNDSSYRKSHMRASSLCPNLSRKSSITTEDSSQGFLVNYSTLPNARSSQATITSSPTKYATLPRSTIPSGTAAGSPLRGVKSLGTAGQPSSASGTPVGSCNTTPVPSPRLGKRGVGGYGAQKPGAIDNTSLIGPNTLKVSTLTNEGGRLKKDRMLARGRDFELLPDAVWKALSTWYGGSPALPRTVIIPSHSDTPELELYPVSVRLLRHQMPSQRPNQATSFTSMMGGIGGMVANTTGIGAAQPTTPRRVLAFTAAFSRKHTLEQVYEFLTARLRISREDMRLWKFKDEPSMQLLEEEDLTMEELGIDENMQLLIEVRNKDLTWPEELSQLAKNKAVMDKQVPTDRGATGLNNLGNTCFMNSALQCVSNTRILTYYFTGGMHLYEINRTNPLGMKGHIAQRYGDLIKDLWSGTAKSIAPLKLRWTIGKYAPRFNSFQQQDSQELLAFLLDGLHEDLNRVHDKPYVELKDSDGRPDHVVAKEALENHLIRNRSVIIDLFHGQLKSSVRCIECGHTSVRFDPFTFLSLPLPMESCIHLEVIVAKLDGGVPTKYGLRLNMDEKYRGLKQSLGELSGIPTTQILLVEILGAFIKSFPQDNQKVKTLLGGYLYAYEMPPMAPIPTLTALEERGLKNNGPVQCGLNQIQRMQPKKQFPPTHKEGTPLLNGTSSNHSSPTHQPSANGDAPSNNSTQVMPNTTIPNGVSGNHSRNVSSVTSYSMNSEASSPTAAFNPTTCGFIVAVHRKMIRMDVYFLSSQKTRPSLFGTPLILPCEEATTHQDLYRHVWTQVSRLVSPLPPTELSTSNHAQDCDDSLGYEYPFTLKVVQKDGFTCAWCPWFRFCRGCKMECNTESFNYGSSFVAVDWEPTALHLRYQTSQEKIFQDHTSVDESRRLQTEPIDLDACLRAFTKEEQLGEDEQVYCSKCKKHRLAAKKLEIWKLPPILIVHLKRFQFLNGRWVKSHKIVKFPSTDFDPTHFLVQRSPPAVKSSPSLTKLTDSNGSTNHNTNGCESSDSGIENNISGNETKGHPVSADDRPVLNGDIAAEEGTSSVASITQVKVKSKVKGDTTDEDSEDSTRSSEEHDEDHEDYSNVRYNLYSMSCHTGILGGGHYVAYAKNPNNKWYCYNDSSCKEISEDVIDTNSAYILFYERNNLDYGSFMPDVSGKDPDTTDIDDEFESDFKKMCSIQ